MSAASGENRIEIPGFGPVVPGSADDARLGALLGMATGDALGTTYEFERLEQTPYPTLATGPATDIVGGGPFGLRAGQVTDDTQMAICIARSLLASPPAASWFDRLNAQDLATRYVAWYQHAFDVGSQTSSALGRIQSGDPIMAAGRLTWHGSGRRAAGNGSLMRTAPLGVALAACPLEQLVEGALTDSLLTHADPRCVLAVAVFDAAIAHAIRAAIPSSSASSGDSRDGATSHDGRDRVGTSNDDRGRATSKDDRGRATSNDDRGRATSNDDRGRATSNDDRGRATSNDGRDANSDDRDAMRARGEAMLVAGRAALPLAVARLRELWSDDRDDLAAITSAEADVARDLEAARADHPDVYSAELHVHRTAGFVRVAFRLAFWHLVHTPWRDAVVDVASRGGDADTNAAIVGALVGARDGVSRIPPAWLERVLSVTQPGPADWADAHHPRHLVALASSLR